MRFGLSKKGVSVLELGFGRVGPGVSPSAGYQPGVSRVEVGEGSKAVEAQRLIRTRKRER